MEIRVERPGRHVAMVTIDNQRRLNAMTRPMMAELGRVWDELERGDCRCIVLTDAIKEDGVAVPGSGAAAVGT